MSIPIPIVDGLLNIGGKIQVRYVADFRNDSADLDEDTATTPDDAERGTNGNANSTHVHSPI